MFAFMACKPVLNIVMRVVIKPERDALRQHEYLASSRDARPFIESYVQQTIRPSALVHMTDDRALLLKRYQKRHEVMADRLCRIMHVGSGARAQNFPKENRS